MGSFKKEEKKKKTSTVSNTSKEESKPLGARRIRVVSPRKLFKDLKSKPSRRGFISNDEETDLATGGTVGLP